jgi:hypothetical protein
MVTFIDGGKRLEKPAGLAHTEHAGVLALSAASPSRNGALSPPRRAGRQARGAIDWPSDIE